MWSDKQLVRYVTAFRRGLLNGRSSRQKCFVVCSPLAGLLNYEGVRCELRQSTVYTKEGWDCDHVWIRLADGRVLDPTADQFNKKFKKQMPRVYLGRPVKHLHKHYVTKDIGSNL